MSINSINSVDTNFPISNTKSLRQNNVGAEDFLYKNCDQISDCVEFSKSTEKSDTLRENFEKIKDEQGLIGKAWDGIKNLFHMKNGSEKVEQALEQYESGELSEEEAKNTLEKYENGQLMCVDVIGDITSGIIAVGAAAFAPVTGGASLLIAAGTGAAVKTAIKASDAAIGGREYGVKDLGYDLITGSINGAMAPLSNALGGAVGTTVAKAAGLEAVETTAKTAGKGMLANLLAKQGTEYAAKEGLNLGLKTLGAKAITYGADMAVDGALSGAADGFSRALGEGRIENIGSETLRSAFGGLIAAPIIGGSTRLIFKGASKLNSKIFHNSSDTIADFAADKALKNSAGSIVDSADELVFSKLSKETQDHIYKLQELIEQNPNSRAKDILNAAKSAAQKGDTKKLSRISTALNLLDTNSGSYKELESISKELSDMLSSNTFTKESIEELNEALNTQGAKINYKPDGIYTSANEYGDISARAKSSKSIASKIRNKIFDLDADMPSDIQSAQTLIGDAQGTRFILKNSQASKSIQKAAQQELGTKSETKLFMKYLKKGASGLTDEQLSTFKKLETKILNQINEEQTDSFVTNFANAIAKGKLTVTEINNYAGDNGLPYLSEKQVNKIKEAYEEWFENTIKETKDQTNVRYSIFKTDKGVECLYDNQSNNSFKPSMKVKSLSTSEKAVKSNGYTAAQFNIINKFGQNEELQFRGSELNILAEIEHIVYDAKKGKETVSAPIYDKIKKILSKVENNETLNKSYDDYFRDIFYTARKREIGIKVKMPKITDYSELVNTLSKEELNMLSLDGVNKLHRTVEKLKKANKL